MKDPRNADERVSAYVDGELPPEEVARVEACLARDPEARAAVEDYRRLDRLVRELEPPILSEERWARVRAAVASSAPPRLESTDQVRRRRWNRIFRLRATAFAAGLLAAAACGLFAVLPRRGPVEPPPPPPFELDVEPDSRYIPQIMTSPDGEVVGITVLSLPGDDEEDAEAPKKKDSPEEHE